MNGKIIMKFMGDRTLIKGKVKYMSLASKACAADNLLTSLCSSKTERIVVLKAILEKEESEESKDEG